MARSKRQWVSQDVGSYHIISRVAGGELLFGDRHKEYFLKLLEILADAFFVEIHAFAIMSNHFHILATGQEQEALLASKEELLQRYRLMYGKTAEPPSGSSGSWGEIIPDEDGGVERLRQRLGSVSRFTQELKQNFSRWYNKTHDRKGYLWGDRFKGVIISKGDTQLACSAYIDLNPVRAKIVEKPEDYRWCSLGLRVRQPRRANKLLRPLSILSNYYDMDELNRLAENFVKPQFKPMVLKKRSSDHYSNYRDFVYVSGGISEKMKHRGNNKSHRINNDVVEYHKNFGIADRLGYRIKNFSEGIALGNYDLISNLQKKGKRKYIRPRSCMGEDNNCSWAYTTRVFRT